MNFRVVTPGETLIEDAKSAAGERHHDGIDTEIDRLLFGERVAPYFPASIYFDWPWVLLDPDTYEGICRAREESRP